MGKFRCFVVEHRDDSTVFVIGKKTKKSKVHCGSVVVDLNGNVISIHISSRDKKSPVTIPMRKDILIDWIDSYDFVIGENTDISVKVKKFDKELKKHVKNYYIPYEEWKETASAQ